MSAENHAKQVRATQAAIDLLAAHGFKLFRLGHKNELLELVGLSGLAAGQYEYCVESGMDYCQIDIFCSNGGLGAEFPAELFRGVEEEAGEKGDEEEGGGWPPVLSVDPDTGEQQMQFEFAVDGGGGGGEIVWYEVRVQAGEEGMAQLANEICPDVNMDTDSCLGLINELEPFLPIQ